jgi:NAD(P)-dependent dehydrogenase (short-subunit alcohol dehydrogenase family)
MENQPKIALITGGSRGLGKNAALRLSENGTDVILTYRSRKEEADAVVNQIRENGRKALALPLEIADIGSYEAFMQELSQHLQTHWNTDKFDFLINNAGNDSHALFEQTTEEAFDRLFNVHFKGTYFFTQRSLNLLADGGRIVNLSTGLTRFASPGYSAYASMKGAIETFTKYLAKELGTKGITANLVAPGPIETDFTRGAFEANPKMKDFLSSQTALGRVGVADDIGGIVAFLCSKDARWITAQRIEASGGLFL